MQRSPIRVWTAVWVLALASACASTDVKIVRTDLSGSLPRPERVLVYDFAVDPGEVQLDRGVSARAVAAAKGKSRTAQELQAGSQVADALAQQLVEKIQALGLVAERASGPPPRDTNDLLIKGHFISIDEGNRTERVVIGLGAGRTDLQAEVLLFQGGLLVEQLETDAKSGAKPGMAETMGAGAAAGNLAASAVVSTGIAGASEAYSANIEADAARTAEKVAKELEAFFASEGWIR